LNADTAILRSDNRIALMPARVLAALSKVKNLQPGGFLAKHRHRRAS
jgi:hypothetical protein